MSPLDAYGDEMEPVLSGSERDIERLFAGHEPADDDSLAELASFVRDVRETCAGPAAEHVEAAHLAALLAAVRDADRLDPERRTPRTTRRTRMLDIFRRRSARALALAAIIGALTAGLAAAGVDLPALPSGASDEAEEALARASEAREAHGEATAAGPPELVDALREHIASIEAAAGENGNGRANEDGAGLAGETQGSRATGDEASGGVAADARAGQVDGGKSVGDQASGGVAGRATANAGPQGGAETGDQASGGVAGEASGNGGPQGGAETGDQASGGVSGQAGESGEEAAADDSAPGQGRRP